MSTDTPRNMIRLALKSINYLSRNQSPTSSEEVDAFQCLNEMIDTWRRNNLYCYQEARQTLSITANDGDYTWGSGGDITATPRPDALDGASYLVGSGVSQLEQPIHVIQTWQEWQNYPLKNQTSTYPLCVWFDSAYSSARANLYFRPIPTRALTAVLYCLLKIDTISTVTTTITLPDGYLRALRYNLAVELGAMFNTPVRPDVIQLAKDATEWLKSSNMKLRPISPDPAASSPSQGSDFNILAGDFSGRVLHS